MPATYLPILFMLALSALVAVGMLTLSYFAGVRRTKTDLSPYESGMPSYDAAHKRISVKFFIVAMIFILFDVEAAFLYPWAVAFRDFVGQGSGLFMLAEMGIFLALLGLGYVYLWRKGALEWEK